MKRTLVPHGDDWALVLDMEHVEAMGAGAGTPLAYFTDGKVLVVIRADLVGKDGGLEHILAGRSAKYGGVFRRLAD